MPVEAIDDVLARTTITHFPHDAAKEAQDHTDCDAHRTDQDNDRDTLVSVRTEDGVVAGNHHIKRHAGDVEVVRHAAGAVGPVYRCGSEGS